MQQQVVPHTAPRGLASDSPKQEGPAPFEPANAIIDLDERYQTEQDQSDQDGSGNDRPSEVKVRRYIKGLPASFATQLHTLIVEEGPDQGMTDQRARVFIGSLEALHLPARDDYRFRQLEKEILRRPNDVAQLLRDRLLELDLNDDDGVIAPGRFVKKPTELRAHEREGLLVPNLLRCVDAHFSGSTVPFLERTLLDLGAWDGRLSSLLASRFQRVVAAEPDAERYAQLQYRFESLGGLQSGPNPRQYVSLNEGIQSLVDRQAAISPPPDVILLSHVLYFVREGGYDCKALDWALQAVKPGGIVIAVLNDIERIPGTRAHFRDYMGAEETSRDPRQYYDHLAQRGCPLDAYRVRLQLRASGRDARHALHELMYYMVPGVERRNRAGALQAYTHRFLHDGPEGKTYGLDHRLIILVARRPAELPAQQPRLSLPPRPPEIVEPAEAAAPERKQLDPELARLVCQLNLPNLSERDLVYVYRRYRDMPDIAAEGAYARQLATIARDELILRVLPVARHVAQKLHAHLAQRISEDDLLQAGMFMALHRIDRFDPDRSKIATYFARVCWGGMMDHVRELDWVPRLDRLRIAKINKERQKLFQEGVDNITPELVAARAKLKPEIVAELWGSDDGVKKMVSLSRKWFESDSGKDVTEVDVIKDHKQREPSESIEAADFYRWATQGMTAQESNIVLLYLEQHLTMKEIAEFMEISESRISQIFSNLEERIRARFQDLTQDVFGIRDLQERIADERRVIAASNPPQAKETTAGFGGWKVTLVED